MAALKILENKQRPAGLLITALFAAALTACGGSSSSSGGGDTGGDTGGGEAGVEYEGKRDSVKLTKGNKEEAESAAKEGTIAAIRANKADKSPFGASITTTSPSTFPSEQQEKISAIVNQFNDKELAKKSVVTAVEIPPELGECGGEARFKLTRSGHKIIFDDYCVRNGEGEKEEITGTSIYTGSESSYKLVSKGFTVNGESVPDFTLDCTGAGVGCVYTSDFYGTDGNIYQMESWSVGTDASGNYEVDVSICSYNLEGCITAEGTGLVLCEDENEGFSAGTITVTGSEGGEADIEYQGCGEEPVITYYE